MSNKLLGMNTESLINIGDYIQALAANQYFNKINGFIQRERLDKYDEGQSNLIMNGWYMHHPENWPPSKKINPLFIAFHINIEGESGLLTSQSLNYLKQYEPIGCRDKRTVQLLQSNNINAYFSGCLTLTLGGKYLSSEKDGSIYFVDTPFVISPKRIQDSLFCLLHFPSCVNIAKKYFKTTRPSLRQIKNAGGFIRTYRNFFSIKILSKVQFINHVWPNTGASNEELLEIAEKLVLKYAAAALVVTTRIHCALPCLALETPVIYIDNSEAGEVSECRLGGLKELFNIIHLSNNKLAPDPSFKFHKITQHYIPHNKEDWRPLARELKQRCLNWIASLKK